MLITMVTVSGHTGVLYQRKQRMKMFDDFKSIFNKLSPVQVSTDELLEAEMSLLKAETGVEYALSMVQYNKARMKRLKAYINDSNKETL
jgi:hypothetical protein